jgi:hypothetical protein
MPYLSTVSRICNVSVYGLIAFIQTFGVDAEQDFNALSRTFGDLGHRYSSVEPQGNGGVPQIAGHPSL